MVIASFFFRSLLCPFFFKLYFYELTFLSLLIDLEYFFRSFLSLLLLDLLFFLFLSRPLSRSLSLSLLRSRRGDLLLLGLFFLSGLYLFLRSGLLLRSGDRFTYWCCFLSSFSFLEPFSFCCQSSKICLFLRKNFINLFPTSVGSSSWDLYFLIIGTSYYK